MTVYGLDIGGTKIETAIFDDSFQLQKSWRVSTPIDNYPLFIETIRAQVNQADKLSGKVGKVGIGMPGLIHILGQSLSANVPCATGKFIADDLKKILKRPIALQNDTRCFALSEATGGAGDKYKRIFGAIIGTGAAGGFCYQGKIDISQQGIAGEYGHIPLPADIMQQYKLPIIRCGCGLVGCVENYIAGPGISRLCKHIIKQEISSEQWAERLKQKDPQAELVLQCYLDILGSTFATLMKFLDPDAIILGGGVSHINQIIDNLPSAIEKYLFTGFKAPFIAKAKYGDSSGVRGAAILGKNNEAS